MDETIILPSPNWFQVSGLAVSKDGWLVYGGPSKSLCVLEPLPKEYNRIVEGSQKYHAHVVNRAHLEKIVSVDISPEWPEKRAVLTGSADGSVKQWNLELLKEGHKLKPTHSHEVHSQEKEDIAGLGYSDEVTAITVGGFGNIVKWNLNTNIVKTYPFLRNFKPVCMSCSPHIPLNVAVGTKQGVVFLLDLTGAGKVIYKVRGQDDEIANLRWCPKYEVALKKTLKDSGNGGKESGKRAIIPSKASQHKEEIVHTEEAEKKVSMLPKANQEKEEVVSTEEASDVSGCGKNLPEDSFDESIVVPEDDMFDIYTDHAADEFGHKKYEPEDILVKVHHEADKQDDYLTECLKLKEDILKRKTESDSSIQNLVDALDKTHVGSKDNAAVAGSSTDSSLKTDNADIKINKKDLIDEEASAHIHKHLLATISKFGAVRVWSKSGKQVGSCVIPYINNKNQKNKVPFWPTLLWYKSGVLLLADGKNQLLQCNPLKINCKNKLEWSPVHSLHKRGIYCIASNAPRLQTLNDPCVDWHIWTTSQDRNIVQYSLNKRQKVAIHSTCGGFLYTVAPCPYDADKVAISVGDGAVRIWETSTSEDDDTKLHNERVTTYWQNVQGKVLVCAWHPTRENLLAFATAESRVGLIDTGGKTERSARVLVPALNGGVYSIAWGQGHELYACSSGDPVLYHTDRPDDAPESLAVTVEGVRWAVSCVQWAARGLACGSAAGAVAVLEPRPPHAPMASVFLCSKIIHMIEWHPQQTSSSSEDSPHKNLMAVCSMDKESNIVILEYVENEEGKQLQIWKKLSGHRAPVLQIIWNPHIEARLLSTSQDCTVRAWDAVSGACLSIFPGHASTALGAAWGARPALAGAVVSGGGDCCLRLWAAADHPPGNYDPDKHELAPKKEKKKKHKKEQKNKEKKETDDTEERTETDVPTTEQVASTAESKIKICKKFLLPIVFRQIWSPTILQGVRLMVQKHLEKTSPEKLSEFPVSTEEQYDLDFVKMFGTINEVNELLDLENEDHLERNRTEAWAMLFIFRGHIDAMIQLAAQHDSLCPFLVSVAPCVSFKYWKDATQLYLEQIDRLVGKGQEEKLCDSRSYGGAIYRKVATLLSIHDVKGAVATLNEAQFYKEAYILCRTRYMDSIAEQTLKQWAEYCVKAGTFAMAAVCYIALGNLSEAATLLGKLNDQESLKLAADIAKIVGHNTFADHVSEKRENIKSTDVANENNEMLKELPSRFEALMNVSDKIQNGETIINGISAVENGGGDAKE